MYENQAEIGHALQKVFKEGKIKRDDVWITSKVSHLSLLLGKTCLYMTAAGDLWALESAHRWQSWPLTSLIISHSHHFNAIDCEMMLNAGVTIA